MRSQINQQQVQYDSSSAVSYEIKKRRVSGSGLLISIISKDDELNIKSRDSSGESM